MRLFATPFPFLAALAILQGALAVAAAENAPLLPDAVPLAQVDSYAQGVPRPHEVIGHRIGQRHTEPHQLVEYFRAVADASERVTVHEYARSYENRPLIYAVATSPANHRRLDQILKQNRRLSDAADQVADEQLAGQPLIVYLGYGVHGDEASGGEAALLLLYHLAAGEGEAIRRMLDETVVLIDPDLNPDGRQRFTTWVNQNRGTTPVSDPADREHHQPWPGGRTNHYWFDLNRDWMPVRHPESRGRLELLNRWRPQIVGDFHEMGSHAHYFFQPGVPSRVNRNIPPANQQLTAEIAAYHARSLDQIGSLYFTREGFDDFYPGKGSTYADLVGAVGILFEQGSSRALLRETEHGRLDYDFTVRNQFAASLSTMQAAVALRERLLRYQRDFYRDAGALARSRRVSAYLISLEPARTQAQELIRLLLAHRIRVHRLNEKTTAGGETFRPGSAYVVPVDQPQVRLLTAMMQRQTDFDDPLFYDISTWTLPLAFGVRSAEYEGDPLPLIGEAVADMELDGGRLVGGKARYAYLIPWNRYFAPRTLYKLQQAGVRTRLITQPFSIEVKGKPRAFDRGTILIALQPRPGDEAAAETVHRLIPSLVADDHVEVFAVHGGAALAGPDLGSTQHVHVLEQPVIALLTGPSVSGTSAGEVWHLLSHRFGIPVSLVDVGSAGRETLGRYNTLVLSGGSYGGLSADAVRSWVQDGGRLIAIGSGADWAVQNKLVELQAKAFDLDALVKDRPFDELADARREHQISGAILEARLDATHPLALGYRGPVSLLRNHATFYEPAAQAGTNVAVYAPQPLLSGYVSAERQAQIPGSAAIVAVRMGKGRIVLLMDNPNFRAFWYGGNGLFLNAIFLGTAF